jgi:hypothetical protein
LKNLTQEIEHRLVAEGMRSSQAKGLVQPARDLAADPVFWRERSEGLAAFMSPDTFRGCRLPERFDERVMVNNRFHIRPLLPLLSGGQRFFVLALSQNEVRLFEASRYEIRRLDVAGLPAGMSQTLNYTPVDGGFQVHAATRGSGALGKKGVVFHGQGGASDAHKSDLVNYLRQVDASVGPVLAASPAPLLLAGVGYLLQIYREICTYSDLAAAQLEGNCEHFSLSQLRERAWSLIEPALQTDREKAARRYLDLAGTGLASDNLAQVLVAAQDGRIDVLFIDSRAQQWGTLRSDDRKIELHESRQTGDDDLLDLAATETLLHRGTVYCLDRENVPGGRNVAALFRY